MSDKTIVSPQNGFGRNLKAIAALIFPLVIFGFLFFFSLFAELISNDKPVVFSYDSKVFLPLIIEYPETDFGGIFRHRRII